MVTSSLIWLARESNPRPTAATAINITVHTGWSTKSVLFSSSSTNYSLTIPSSISGGKPPTNTFRENLSNVVSPKNEGTAPVKEGVNIFSSKMGSLPNSFHFPEKNLLSFRRQKHKAPSFSRKQSARIIENTFNFMTFPDMTPSRCQKQKVQHLISGCRPEQSQHQQLCSV